MCPCNREHCLSSALPFSANPLRDRKCWTQGVACCLNGSVCSWRWSPWLVPGSPLEQPNGPKPLFSCRLPCGLNGFRSTLYPWLAANRSGISPLLPKASADEAAHFCFSSCSLGRSKWPARAQLATCSSLPGGPGQRLFRLHERSSRPCNSKWEKRVNEGWGEGGSICPIQICLIGFDSNNYRVIMAFSTRPRRSESQLLHAPACCQMVYSREWVTESGERERWGNSQWTLVKQWLLSLW